MYMHIDTHVYDVTAPSTSAPRARASKHPAGADGEGGGQRGGGVALEWLVSVGVRGLSQAVWWLLPSSYSMSAHARRRRLRGTRWRNVRGRGGGGRARGREASRGRRVEKFVCGAIKVY